MRIGRARANEFYHQGARTIEDLKSGRFDLTEGQRVPPASTYPFLV